MADLEDGLPPIRDENAISGSASPGISKQSPLSLPLSLPALVKHLPWAIQAPKDVIKKAASMNGKLGGISRALISVSEATGYCIGFIILLACGLSACLALAVTLTTVSVASAGALLRNNFGIDVVASHYIPLAVKISTFIFIFMLIGMLILILAVLLLIGFGMIFSEQDGEASCITCLSFVLAIFVFCGGLIAISIIVSALVLDDYADVRETTTYFTSGVLIGLSFVRFIIVNMFTKKDDPNEEPREIPMPQTTCLSWVVGKACDVGIGAITYRVLVDSGRIEDVPGMLPASALLGFFQAYLLIPASPALFPEAFLNATGI